MQIVIDIPETVYYMAQRTNILEADIERLTETIKNGTPLPEGHGRLIDADELKKHKYHDSDRYENAVSVAQIDWQPTIIEAESEV